MNISDYGKNTISRERPTEPNIVGVDMFGQYVRTPRTWHAIYHRIRSFFSCDTVGSLLINKKELIVSIRFVVIIFHYV